MRFDIYGRFRLEVVREQGRWVAYRLGTGTRRPEPDLVIPENLLKAEMPSYLDDVYHENARRFGKPRSGAGAQRHAVR